MVGSSLGRNTKSASGPENSGSPVINLRYRLLETAGGLLTKSRLPGSMVRRVQCCSRRAAEFDIEAKKYRSRDLEVVQNPAGGRHRYRGLCLCSRVWLCPVCASRISEFRRKELFHGWKQWQQTGGSLCLVTRTFPHHAGDRLADLLRQFRAAMRRSKSGRAAKAIASEFGIAGSVRCIETTWGPVNGWHPHSHEVFFLRDAVDLVWLRRRLYVEWARACRREGLPTPSYRHGLDVRPVGDAIRYLGKWGVDAELTKWQMKKPTGERFTPWAMLLLESEAAPSSSRFKSVYGMRWVEFAEASKGVAQLYWSQGLKRALGVPEFNDEEAAKQAQAEDLYLYSIEAARDRGWSDWSLILRYGLRDHALDLSEVGGRDSVRALCMQLRRRAMADLSVRLSDRRSG